METQKLLLKDEDGEEVDVHLYRSMIGSLMYLTSSRPDIMFAVCQPKLGLWYPKYSSFDLVAYTDSDYARVSLDRKSTTRVAVDKCFGFRINYLIMGTISCIPKSLVLTVNPTMHISCIEQLWTTIKAKTVNGEVQLQALVDGKKIIITESIKQRSRRSKRKDTEVPQPSGPITNVADEAVNEEMDDSLVRTATTATSLDAESRIGTRSDNVPKLSNDPLLVRVLDLENTKTAQAQEITSLKLRVKKLEKKGWLRTHKLKRLYKVGRSARVISYDEASLGDQEDASKQGRKINSIDKDAEITLVDETQGRYGDDLMFDTGVLDDEEVFAGQDMAEKEINVAEKEVSTADPVTTASEVVTTAGVEISTASPTKTTISNDLTLAQTLIEIKSAKPKVKGVVIGEQSESTTRTRPQQLPSKDKAELEEEDRLVRQTEEEANIVSWDNVQAMIDVDYQMAQQMKAEEQEKLSIEEKSKLFVQLLESRKKYFAAMRAQEKRNIPPTKDQKRKTMSTYLKNMVGYKHNQLKNKSFDDIQKLFDKAMNRVNIFVDMDTELVEGSENAKKQKVDDDKETIELKSLMEVMPDEKEVALDDIPLAVKSPRIVDWKVHEEGKKSYYQIIWADGSSKMYLVFSRMLKSFDREDLETLYKLVNAKYGSTRPVEDLDLVLYGDLKTMFEPNVEDNVWKNQSDYRVLDWKLYDSCRVHSLRKQNVHIHMLVEKRYPFTAPTITDMLNKKLQADHWNEICYQLLKLVTK
ncbi:hypothetical protein Tco_0154339 [Tanacetum coccineum]